VIDLNYGIPKYPRMRNLREDKELSQKDMAGYLNVKPNTYSRYETGTNSISLDAMGLLADFYNTSVDYLMSRTDDPRPYPPKCTKYSGLN